MPQDIVNCEHNCKLTKSINPNHSQNRKVTFFYKRVQCIGDVVGNGSIIIFHRSKVMKTQVLHFGMWYFWWGCRGNLKLITLDYSSKIWGLLVQLSSNLNEYQVLSLHCVSSSTIAENKIHCQAGRLSFYVKLFGFIGLSVPCELLWTFKNIIQEICHSAKELWFGKAGNTCICISEKSNCDSFWN